jgi:hypothetical protein
VLPLLDSAGAKMLKLEEVVCDQLEVEGHVLAEKVVEHMLMCFRSWDPVVSLDPVMLGPVAWIEKAASCGVQEAVKAVAARFQRVPEDALGSHSSFCFWPGLLCVVNNFGVTSIACCSLVTVVFSGSLAAQRPKKTLQKNDLLVGCVVMVVCIVVPPWRHCQKSGNDYHLVQDVDGGTLGGDVGDPGAPTTNAKNIDSGPPRRRCWRSRSVHHQRKKHRWWAPWEAMPGIRECPPSTLKNIDGGPPGRRSRGSGSTHHQC